MTEIKKVPWFKFDEEGDKVGGIIKDFYFKAASAISMECHTVCEFHGTLGK